MIGVFFEKNRKFCAIYNLLKKHSIIDESKFGTFINGRKCIAGENQLNHGDRND
jgi:pSer/pThr/pTyr-binding forkhead associated (FHA) protein